MSTQNNRQPNQALCMLVCNKIRHQFKTEMRKLVSSIRFWSRFPSKGDWELDPPVLFCWFQYDLYRWPLRAP